MEKALYVFAGVVLGAVVLAALARMSSTRAQAVRVANFLADVDDVLAKPAPPAPPPPVELFARPTGLAPLASPSMLRLFVRSGIAGA